MSVLTIDPAEVLVLGAIASVAVVGFNQSELAPATGLIGGAAAGWVKHSLLGFCLFKGKDRCRRERNAAMIAGALIGVGFGVVRRGYERAK